MDEMLCDYHTKLYNQSRLWNTQESRLWNTQEERIELYIRKLPKLFYKPTIKIVRKKFKLDKYIVNNSFYNLFEQNSHSFISIKKRTCNIAR